MIKDRNHSPGLSRRHVVAGAVILPAMSFADVTVALAETKVVVAKVANDFALMMADYGVTLGFFQKRGLNVEVIQLIEPRMIQGIVAGSVDFALEASTGLPFAVRGAPFKVVAGLDGPPLLLVLVVAANGHVESVTDLRGRTVAITSEGSLTDWAVSQIAARQGWPLSDIKRISVGDTLSRIATIKTGAADATVMDIATALELERKSEGRILVNFGEIITRFQNQMIFASNRNIRNEPATVRAFIAGMLETLAHARSNRHETVAFAAKELGIDAEVAARTYDILIRPGFFSYDGTVNLDVIREMSRDFAKFGMVQDLADFTAFIDTSMLPQHKFSGNAQ